MLTYSLLVFLLVLLIGVAVYQYYARFIEERAEESYTLVVDRIGRQLDSLFSTMDFVIVNLVSDVDFKDALIDLDGLDRGASEVNSTVESAAQVLSRSVMMHSLHKADIDVVVNTPAGDLFSSDFIDHDQARGSGEWGRMPDWASEVFEADGPARVVGPFADPWDDRTPEELFGIARSIRGARGSLGIIGAYQDLDILDQILSAPNSESVGVVAYAPDGSLLHATRSLSAEDNAYLRALAGSTDGFVENPTTGERQFLGVSDLRSGWGRVIIIVDREVLLSTLSGIQWLTIGLGALVFLVSVVYNYISSKALTRPLRSVQQHIEETDLGNLVAGPPLAHYNDELVSLDRAFNRLKERLDEAIRREISSHMSTMQARLDSLQAQINPHFLYNTLTVIANRGLELGDTEIGEMCDGIASMLRYSTATTERYATLGQELDHVRSYLFLMGKRLEERLLVEINVDPSITSQRVPKIVFQQLVENAINHGYKDKAGPVIVEIIGASRDGHWEISISDRGCGFDNGTLERLREEMAEIDREIDSDGVDNGFEIGGLGVLNTYSRMHLFYGGSFLWRMENREGGGAVVTVGAPMEGEEAHR